MFSHREKHGQGRVGRYKVVEGCIRVLYKLESQCHNYFLLKQMKFPNISLTLEAFSFVSLEICIIYWKIHFKRWSISFNSVGAKVFTKLRITGFQNIFFQMYVYIKLSSTFLLKCILSCGSYFCWLLVTQSNMQLSVSSAHVTSTYFCVFFTLNSLSICF